MSLFDLFRRRQPSTAATAKERLQVIIASEGHGGASSEIVQQIKQAVMEAISKFITVQPSDISVERDTRNNMEMLSVSVSLPEKLESVRKPAPEMRAPAQARAGRA